GRGRTPRVGPPRSARPCASPTPRRCSAWPIERSRNPGNLTPLLRSGAVYERELEFAHSLADRAAEIAMGFYEGGFEVREKPDSTPVTDADLAVEAMVRERIAAEFPDDAVLGEEHGLEGSGDRVWVVDPIDGT